MKRKRITTVIVFLILAVGIVGVYYYFLTHPSAGKENLTAKKSLVEELIDKDLDIYYPATVTTVMDTYCKYTQALFNETYSEDEYTKLVRQYRRLLDDELLAQNPEDTQIESMKSEIASFKDDKKYLFSYRVADDTANKERTVEGKKCATITMVFSIHTGNSGVETTVQTFILRQDSKDKWKILGWQLESNGQQKKNASASPSPTPSPTE